jgi:hypothetical protein
MGKIFKTVFHQWQSIVDNSNRNSFTRTLGTVPANAPAAELGAVPSGTSRKLWEQEERKTPAQTGPPAATGYGQEVE